LCHLHLKLIGFYNRDEKCLQRGTDWVFKKSSLRFVSKWLTLQSTCLVPRQQQTEDLLRPSTPLSSNCCQAQQYHQNAARYVTLIKMVPGTPLSSNCCQTQQCHQNAARHSTISKRCQVHHCHQNVARHSSVIKLLPGTAVSSKCCQAQHHIKMLPGTPLSLT